MTTAEIIAKKEAEAANPPVIPPAPPKPKKEKPQKKERVLSGVHPSKWSPKEDGCNDTLRVARWASETFEVEGEDAALADWHYLRKHDLKTFLARLTDLEKANDIRLGKFEIDKAAVVEEKDIDMGADKAEALILGLLAEFEKEQ